MIPSHTPDAGTADQDPAFESDLAGQIAIALSKLGTVLRSHSWKQSAPHGVNPTQSHILRLLRSAAGPLRVQQLARGLGVTDPTASDAVRALMGKGLVDKVRSAGDRRAVSITLTKTGRAVADEQAWPDFIGDVAADLTANEQAALMSGLLKMIRRLQELGQIPVSRMCVSCRYFRPNAHVDQDRPHHCAFVDAAFGDRSLRVHCADHQPADREAVTASP